MDGSSQLQSSCSPDKALVRTSKVSPVVLRMPAYCLVDCLISWWLDKSIKLYGASVCLYYHYTLWLQKCIVHHHCIHLQALHRFFITSTFQLVKWKFGIFGFPTQVCPGRTTAEWDLHVWPTIVRPCPMVKIAPKNHLLRWDFSVVLVNDRMGGTEFQSWPSSYSLMRSKEHRSDVAWCYNWCKYWYLSEFYL